MTFLPKIFLPILLLSSAHAGQTGAVSSDKTITVNCDVRRRMVSEIDNRRVLVRNPFAIERFPIELKRYQVGSTESYLYRGSTKKIFGDRWLVIHFNTDQTIPDLPPFEPDHLVNLDVRLVAGTQLIDIDRRDFKNDDPASPWAEVTDYAHYSSALAAAKVAESELRDLKPDALDTLMSNSAAEHLELGTAVNYQVQCLRPDTFR